MSCRALVAVRVGVAAEHGSCVRKRPLPLFRAGGRKSAPRCVRAACQKCKVPTAAARRMCHAVEMTAPGQPLVVRNIGQEMREDEVVALQRRAACGDAPSPSLREAAWHP